MTSRSAASYMAGPFNEKLVIEEARRLLRSIGGRVTCGFVFASPDYLDHLADFTEILRLYAHVPDLVGCTGGGLIANGKEMEREVGFSTLLLSLSEAKVEIVPFSEQDIERRRGLFNGNQLSSRSWISLVDPFRLPPEPWLKEWNCLHPKTTIIGGLASGRGDGDHVGIFHNEKLIEDGGLMVGFSGNVEIKPLVSQGCRPIGRSFTVTKAEGSVVFTLGGVPAYEALSETFGLLDLDERQRARGNLFIGLVSSEYREKFQKGDFLIRNLIGADPSNYAIVVGGEVRTGQTLQFQLRDHRSAHEELQHLLQRSSKEKSSPFGALMFTCGGRGTPMFGMPHHDANALAEAFPELPHAGFFCNGEIGPVGDSCFVHGYTASTALFVENNVEK